MNEQTLESGIVVVSNSLHDQELRAQIVKQLLAREGLSLSEVPVWANRLLSYIKTGK